MSESRLPIPKPPTTINKEAVGVWNGWGRFGDKEVVREAASKGLHINLAITFLSQRRKQTFQITQKWFNNEVIKWVHELLDRRQIVRASYVLKNIGLDPVAELSRIFYLGTSLQLRDYIGNELVKKGQLEGHLKQLWQFLKLFFSNSDLVSEYALEVESLEWLDNQSESWKAEIGTILFFKTYDENLTPFLTDDSIWNYLIKNNDIVLLKKWINIQYNPDYDPIEINPILLAEFKKFPLTAKLINTTKELSSDILNELSRFGQFCDKEKIDLSKILKRLNNSGSIYNLYEIFSLNNSMISVSKFLNMVIDYCLENQQYSILNVCVNHFKIVNLKNSPHLRLICDLRKLVKRFDEENLIENIFNVGYIFSDDLQRYFCDNVIVFLCLLVFTKDFNPAEKDTFFINNIDFYVIFEKILKEMPILNEIIMKTKCASHTTTYSLLEKHLNIDMEFLFNLKYENELPHFNRKDLVDTYGYRKQIDYLYYLKQCRPLTAYKFYTGDLRKEKIFKLAIKNYKNFEITASCISFLEMIDVNSDDLRIKITTAKLFDEAQFDNEFTQKILIYNQVDVIQNKLEDVLISKIESDIINDGQQLIDSLKTHSILMKFSKIHQLRQPESFLRYCAYNNLWLPFLIFAQINNYPIETLKILIPYFKNPNLLEHIIHCVINDIQIEEKSSLIGERDSRKYLLSKIGVRQTIIENLTPTSSVTSYSSYGSAGSSNSSSEPFEIDVSNIKATLLQTLIRCHNSTDPPKALLQACQFYRNPILAILATSYEPDSKITNWLNWLAVSSELCQPFFNYESIAYLPNSVIELLLNSLRNRYPRALLESFMIFLPENPLCIFIHLVNDLLKLNFNEIQAKLELFKNALKPLKKYNLSEPDHELTYLNNKAWIESTALRLLSAALDYNCNSLYEQITIVKLLNQLNISKYFSTTTANFANLLHNLTSLLNCGSNIRINIENVFNNNREAVISCINLLMDTKLYNVAMEIAQTENLPSDIILVNKFENSFEQRFDTKNFWQNCDKIFKENNVIADCVVNFYENSAEKLYSLEKYEVLKLACKWAAEYELSTQYELEIKMWLAFISVGEKVNNLEHLNIQSTFHLYKDMCEKLENVEIYKENLNKDFVIKIESVLKHCLNCENFWLALKLQKMFDCHNSDLEILKLMSNLAEGLLSPYQLNTQQRLLISRNTSPYNRTKTFLSSRFSGSGGYSHGLFQSAPSFTQSLDISENANDTLRVLKLFSEQLKNGVEIGRNIFMSYRISVNIGIPYYLITPTVDYMNVLKDALIENCTNKLEVVHDFIYVFKWTRNEITDFICEELVNATSQYVESNDELLKMWDLTIDQDFFVILQLLQDNCSLLGNKIFSYLDTLHKSYIEKYSNKIKTKDLVLITELLIRSHDCFTADCNMEGISLVLKKCKEIITDLVTNQNWKLIVRLLTGVGRYGEMSYVFQILLENHQFEFLLRKGSRRDNSLKVALLDYLRKHCPDNRELYQMVALHFTLFSEVALLWEREAQGVIKNLISIAKLEMLSNKMNPDNEPFILFENSEGTKVCLNKAMENYIYATQFHIKGDKLTKAISSANQAELIALQLFLLSEVTGRGAALCILELTNIQIASLISAKLNFCQTQIIIAAYDYQPDWSSIIYQQFILKDNADYFKDFLKHYSLSDNLVSDISKKFVAANNSSANEISNMKEILNKSPSIYLKYRIASELGFTDIVEDMIKSDKLVYLKDTVWKKGYFSN